MTGVLKHIYFNVSLGLEMIQHWWHPDNYPWWHQILPNLYLGAVPLKHRHHHDHDLINLGITHVIGLLEPHENQTDYYWVSPVQPEDWARHGVEYHQYIVPDGGYPDPEQLSQALREMDRILSHPGNHLYVHCKAGKGRSVFLVACYLMRKFNYSADECLEHLSQIRPNISLNETQYHELSRFPREDLEID